VATAAAPPRQQQAPPPQPPLLYVDVAVSPLVTDRIPLWPDSDCAAAAAAFAGKHGLTDRVSARLARMLAAQRDALLAANAGGGISVS